MKWYEFISVKTYLFQIKHLTFPRKIPLVFPEKIPFPEKEKILEISTRIYDKISVLIFE